ncbi:MaoC/PaaZ C-terminal domain-containing protein [Streptomyces chitinivorans]|nr:MaoC/PaaZ C-terminal domain-containing protein [Streptomyces chitinivorans]MDH2408728.1 MaoC/PaaZ C-terminal domain-containing protein [Streptomyces chitinivorans]
MEDVKGPEGTEGSGGAGSAGRGEPETLELPSAPGTAGLYVRAVLPKSGGTRGRPLPARRLVLRDVAADPERLRRYAEVCGFAGAARLPVTYPHIVAFPLAMSLMTRRDFPLPLLGLVHIANRIDRHRPVEAGERLTYRVWAGDLRPHPRGTAFDVTAEADDGTRTVWRSVSTYLRRGRAAAGPAQGAGARSGKAASGAPGGPVLEERWEVPGSAGRAYAAVSGDRNPIHLHPLTARLFGFPRAIAHGMWTKARCLAALEGHLPGACRVDVSFRAPVPLPSAVRFRATGPAASAGTGVLWDFGLRGEGGTGREHLRGEVSALD